MLKLLFSCLFAWQMQAAAIALVAHGIGQGPQTGPATAAFGTSTAGATLLTAAAENYGSDTCTGATIGDTVGGSVTNNVWHHLTNYTDATLSACIWYTYGTASGALVTGAIHVVSESGTVYYPSLAVAAWSGTLTYPTDPYDTGQVNGASSTGALTLSTGSITPSQDCDLVFSGGGFHGTGTPSSSPVPTLDSLAFVLGTYLGIGDAYLVQTTKAAVSTTWTQASSSHIAVSIAAFKAAAGCATGQIRHRVVSQ